MKRTYVIPDMKIFRMNAEEICLSLSNAEADASEGLYKDDFENVFENLW